MNNESGIYLGMKWSYERGSYTLRNEAGLIVLKTQQPAILFDGRNGRLYRHGELDRVERYAAKMRADYLSVGDVDGFLNLVVYTSKMFNVDELNCCVSVDGYCAQLHRRLSIN